MLRVQNIHDTAVICAPADWVGVDARKGVDIGRCRIGPLCVISGGVDRPTKIGDGSYLCSMVYVAHDVEIGEGCTICPGAKIMGFVTIGNQCYIGAGAVIRQRISIGRGVKIGAGAVVVKDIPDNGGVWAGVPARKMS